MHRRRPDWLLSKQAERCVRTALILPYQALCSLWSPNERHLTECCVERPPCLCSQRPDNTPRSMPSATVWGLQLRRQRCSSGFCPSTAERWTHLRHRSCRLACWFSARVENRRRWSNDVSVGHKGLLLAERLLKCDASPPLPNLPFFLSFYSWPSAGALPPPMPGPAKGFFLPLLLVWRSDFDFGKSPTDELDRKRCCLNKVNLNWAGFGSLYAHFMSDVA